MTRADKILVTLALLLSLSSYLVITKLFPRSKNAVAIVEVNGRERLRLSLSRELKPRKVTLNLDKGDAAFDLSDGRIRMLPMDRKICAKRICSKTGWIKSPWQMIVCLPNSIVVRIVGEKKAGDVDLITR